MGKLWCLRLFLDIVIELFSTSVISDPRIMKKDP